METPEPPDNAPSRPNLLAPSRCSADVQQQILARLEQRAAEKNQMIQIARKSLQVAGWTTAGIGAVVALLVYARHQNLPPAPAVPMVVAQAEPPAVLAPLPALVIDDDSRQLKDSSLPMESPSLGTVEAKAEAKVIADPLAQAETPAAVVRVGRPKAVKVVKVLKVAKLARTGKLVKPAKLAAGRARHELPSRKASLQKVALGAMPRARTTTVAMKTSASPIDTDVSLLSAILLHSSRPAVVPAAVLRPPCTKSLTPPCIDHTPDP